jgi:hypothetical protein
MVLFVKRHEDYMASDEDLKDIAQGLEESLGKPIADISTDDFVLGWPEEDGGEVTFGVGSWSFDGGSGALDDECNFESYLVYLGLDLPLEYEPMSEGVWSCSKPIKEVVKAFEAAGVRVSKEMKELANK